MGQRFFLFFILASLSCNIILSHPEINEIMYYPIDNNEWVEVYNPHSSAINLSLWSFSDNKETDSFTCCSFLPTCSINIEPDQYILIVDQDTIIHKQLSNVSFLCVNDNAIGNGLSNTGETLTLFNTTETSSVSYTPSIGANGNNRTLERTDQNTWEESIFSGGTPGVINSVNQKEEVYKSIILSEIYPNPVGEDEQLKPFGEWVELYNSGEKNIDLGILYFKDSKNDSKLSITHSNVIDSLGTIICPKCYKTIYRNKDTDFSLNNDEDKVELYYDTKIIKSVTYSSTIEGMSWSNNNNIWYLTIPTPTAENKFVEECDWQLSLFTSDVIIHNSENFSFSIIIERLLGESQNITVRGNISDLTGNEISSYAPWTQKKNT